MRLKCYADIPIKSFNKTRQSHLTMSYIKKLFANQLYTFRYFYSYLRYRIFVKMGLSLTVGALDAVGLTMFIPLLQIVGNDQESTGTVDLGNLNFLISAIETLGISLNLVNVLILLTSFFILKGIALYINSMYEIKVREFFITTVRVNLAHLLSQMSYKIFVGSDVGRIQNTMTGEVTRISEAYRTYFETFQSIIMITLYMLLAFWIDSTFALLVSLGGIGTNYLFKRVFTATKRASAKLTRTTHKYQGLIIQYVSNFKYLKATNIINEFTRILKRSIFEISSNNKKIGKYHSFVAACREPVLIIVVSAVIFIKVSLIGGALSTIVVSLLFFYRALSHIVYMQSFYNQFLSLSGSLQNMHSFERELRESKEEYGVENINGTINEIALRNISFRYNDTPILNNISLNISKNETIAFVGESGSGKTTLLNVVTGLLPSSEGEIRFDGKILNDLNPSSYRNKIGYITQEPVIFNDTIYNNITLWSDKSPYHMERYHKIIRDTKLDMFIDSLPMKHDAQLGNNGINLSGGQKQRISIARELFKEIDILMLDEATSALDSETEKYIQHHIDMLKGKVTILIVAHRLSTIKNADRIVLMDNGKIIDIDSFDILRETSPRFKQMVDLQSVD